MELKSTTDKYILKLGGRAENTNKILELFYMKPILNVRQISNNLNMNERTVRNILLTLENDQIIIEHTGNKRNKIFIFDRYFKLFNNKNI